jgi:hypothetical protein
VNGAKIRKDDRIISRMLGIHLNKWLKVKKSGIMALLSDHSSGYLTQKRLLKEYKLVVNRPDSPVDNYVDNLELPVDNFDSDDSTPHDTTLDTRGVTPLDTPLVPPENSLKNQHASQNALDRSKSKIKDKNRFLDQDGAGESFEKTGNWLATDKADAFLTELRDAFRAVKMEPPGDYDVMRGWIDNGRDPFRHILPVIQEVLHRVASGSRPPPRSWKYFAKEIYQKPNKRRK